MTDKNKKGKLYGIGIGPGDPELVTLKACNAIKKAAVIFEPVKAQDSHSLAGNIVKELLPSATSKLIPVVMPMSKDRSLLEKSWQQAAARIREVLERGEDCAFLNVGDPLLYGTFIHVFRKIKDTCPEADIEVIPGISALNAAAAGTITELATGDDSIAILSGKLDEQKTRNALSNFETIIFYKISMEFKTVYPILEETGLVDKCVFIKRATMQDETIITDIRKLQGQKLDYFSLMIVRK